LWTPRVSGVGFDHGRPGFRYFHFVPRLSECPILMEEMEEMQFSRRFLLRRVPILAGVCVIILLALELVRVGPPPTINIRPEIRVIGKRTPVTVEISAPRRGLRHVKVEFVQGERVESLAERSYAGPSALNFWGSRTVGDTISFQIGRETITGLKAGHASIRVTADRAGTWLRRPGATIQEVLLPVRLTPPSLLVISQATFVAKGGCEAVVYRVGASSVRDGVRSGKWWFPSYPLPGGSQGERFALFAAPYDDDAPDARIVAVDEAGNEAELRFVDKFIPKKFKNDTVDLTDAFLAKVVPEIMGQTPELKDRGHLLDNYLGINIELRLKNAEVLKELAQKSILEMLWSKPFLSMGKSKVMAGFADARTYSYQGKVIDHQTHLGYDLAATKRAPVPAANDGVVVLARYFGIYGNAVIIDHGCGIQSLYGHLSAIGVTAGQKIARGDIVGQTGETGLAGGDHLHFAIILAGLPVNPVEWWDRNWIINRLARKLGPGFRFSE
jgi:murein DD-endopeptidase MepM/ murein hydrolase activator NlpD